MFASKALPDRFPHRVGQVHVAYKGTLNGERTVYDPRPYDPAMNNPPNPILVEFRRSAPWHLYKDARAEAQWLVQPGARPIPQDATLDQIEHARKVLERLARLSLGTSGKPLTSAA